jgi:hypothetical protein
MSSDSSNSEPQYDPINIIVVIIEYILKIYSLLFCGTKWRYITFFMIILQTLFVQLINVIRWLKYIYIQDDKHIMNKIIHTFVLLIFVYCLYRGIKYAYKNLKYYENLYKDEYDTNRWLYAYVIFFICFTANYLMIQFQMSADGKLKLIFGIILIGLLFGITTFVLRNSSYNILQYKEYPEDEITLSAKSVIFIILYIFISTYYMTLSDEKIKEKIDAIKKHIRSFHNQ